MYIYICTYYTSCSILLDQGFTIAIRSKPEPRPARARGVEEEPPGEQALLLQELPQRGVDDAVQDTERLEPHNLGRGESE